MSLLGTVTPFSFFRPSIPPKQTMPDFVQVIVWPARAETWTEVLDDCNLFHA